jgi:hypothetical protein
MTPREYAVKLPPDVLEHPMPFPVRLDYAEKIIKEAQIEAVKPWKDLLFNLMNRCEEATFHGSWNEINWALKDAETALLPLTGDKPT